MNASRDPKPFALLGCCFAFVLSARPVHADSFKILLSTDTLQPGQTLRVELDGINPELHKKAVFRGHSYAFFPVGPSAQRALIGVALGSDPGDSVLSIYPVPAVSPKAPADDHVTVHVASRTYVVENINLPESKNKLTAWEHQESVKIHQLAQRVTPTQYWEGAFEPPVQGQMEAAFGLKRTRNGTIDAGFHKGVDLRSPAGTPALAANGGVIVLAAVYKAHGRVVMIDHGQGVMTIYLHLQSIAVRPGEKVIKGQKIGRVGSTGLSTAPHIHWQVFVHSVPVDPQQWLDTEY